MPQSDLVLRKLEDLLRNNQVTPQLEKDTGMSRDQMEQFVKKYKKVEKKGIAPAGEIEVKPGETRDFNPNRTLPAPGPGGSISTKTMRDRGSVVQDNLRDNIQGTRLDAPPEIRSRFEAYKSSLSRSRSASPSRPATGPGTGAGAGGQ